MSTRTKRIFALLQQTTSNKVICDNENFELPSDNSVSTMETNNVYYNINSMPVIIEDQHLPTSSCSTNNFTTLGTETISNNYEDCDINSMPAIIIEDQYLPISSCSTNNFTTLETETISNYYEDCDINSMPVITEDQYLATSSCSTNNSTTLETETVSNYEDCIVPRNLHCDIEVPYEIEGNEDSGDSDKSYKPTDESNTDSNIQAVEESVPIPAIENEANDEEDINKARKKKRKADENDWIRTKNKKLRMEGKAYTGFSKEEGKIKQNYPRQERRLQETCSSVCKGSKKRFCSKFSEECRNDIFQKFWQEMSWEQRKVFVSSNVLKQTTRRPSTESSRRQGTFVYFLNNGTEKLQVCRKMFINTLSLGYKTVQEWVNKGSYGMATQPCVKINVKQRFEEGYKHLNDFFNQLPKLPAHYCRKDTLKLYLDMSFQTLSELYKVYQDYCQERHVACMSRNVFNKVFHEKNLSLFRQKKDQCNTCFAHKYGNVTEQEWIMHTEKKEKARKQKTVDKELAEMKKAVALTMDLQAVKLAPFLPAGKIYFKTKLCCHNFTLYNLGSRDVTCYWFSEDQNNQLAASTFTSIIIHYLEKNCVTDTKLPIIIYSDGCGFQNRNNVLSIMLY